MNNNKIALNNYANCYFCMNFFMTFLKIPVYCLCENVTRNRVTSNDLE